MDDVLATGGTLEAANHLCKLAGYDVVDNLVLIDLRYIPRNLSVNIRSLVQYE